ncbi:hypothetical protein GCM10010411_74160 [Actinomadura fulvescens]|uniref:Uncharacterized protein n=1 Tax=Actinomadura fulvescens TaxID=46160 RepID=A0ABP6CR10_9ACTN
MTPTGTDTAAADPAGTPSTGTPSTGADWRERLQQVRRREARVALARTQVADERAAVIDAGVAAHRAERGSKLEEAVRAVAEELGVTPKTVHQARARARRATAVRGLPADILERLFAAEIADLPPMPESWWRVLTWVVGGIAFDPLWVENQPGLLLADEITQAGPDIGDPQLVADLAERCASWSRATALAVIDLLAEAPGWRPGASEPDGHADLPERASEATP